MNNTEDLVTALLTWIRPFIEAEANNLQNEEQLDQYLKSSTVGFGISYRKIVDSAKELGLLIDPSNN